jgi:hypothetical protein
MKFECGEHRKVNKTCIYPVEMPIRFFGEQVLYFVDDRITVIKTITKKKER